MIIEGIKSNVSEPKITSYIININNKKILLDFGAPLSDNILNKIDLVFISHEHKDHISGLIDSILKLRDDCEIIMTKTTKLIILESMRREFVLIDKNKKIKRLEKARELLYEDDFLFGDIILRLYQAGHTYGSSMLYIEGEYKLLYTGDFNYYSKYNGLQYKCDDLDLDYLILDGTNLLKNDYKRQSVTHLNKLSNERPRFYVHARAEKAILIGQILALEGKKNIYYEPDLQWYLNILISQGYAPYLGNLISIDMEDLHKEKDGIYISSVLFESFNKEGNIGLHISNEDIMDFIHRLNSPKVLVGHYRLSSFNEIKELTEYYLLKEGVNNI